MISDRGQYDAVLCCKQSLVFESRISNVMDEFTLNGKADMSLMYGVANFNGRAALSLYRERFPNSTMTNHKIFPRLHRKLCENGSIHDRRQDTGRTRHVQFPELEECILRGVEGSPSTSTR